ncbi:hypothetical protein OIDMADRAFT_182203 [Oidiodendron maius Zn]|uniref:Transcription factor domain-containing protein n=1 Tax=Oidiodendron maius (strain Zn) TaxID=913774 RepID=A0A0C3GP49_OIDMZ|nr:hypothetical protein OIDMADRAFT_182203 [Oidiodendron maius Zn]
MSAPVQSISRVSSNPVKKLEEKLDGIVSLLKASHEIGSAYEHSTTASVRSVNLLDQELKVSSMPPENLNRSSHVQFAQPGVWSRQHAPTSAPEVQDAHARTFNGPEWISSNPLPTEEEAAVLLKTFRDETGLFFPFISIPKSTSVGAFRRERPFTYLAIIAVSTMKYPQGSELGKIIIKQVAERVFVDGERSIDLLLGILTLAAWYFFHLLSIHHLTGLVAAANALVFDLGLLRIPHKESHSLFEEAIIKSIQNPSIIKSDKTFEEKRALLGYFVLSSSISMIFRRGEALRYTSYLEEHRQSLAQSGDHPNDKGAAAIVRLQVFIERIHQSPWNVKSEAPSVTLPVALLVNSIEEQLKQFRDEYSSEMETNKVVLLQYYITQVTLYQVVYSRPANLPNTERPDYKHVELLYACFQATKSTIDLFFSMPARNYCYFSILTWTVMRRALVALQQLTTFNDPDWSLTYVHETLDFIWVLDRFIQRIEEAANDLNLDENHLFRRTAKKMAIAKTYCQDRIASHSASAQSGPSDFPDPNLFDDMWFRDVFGVFDYQYDRGIPEMYESR